MRLRVDDRSYLYTKAYERALKEILKDHTHSPQKQTPDTWPGVEIGYVQILCL